MWLKELTLCDECGSKLWRELVKCPLPGIVSHSSAAGLIPLFHHQGEVDTEVQFIEKVELFLHIILPDGSVDVAHIPLLKT